ncbi:MAG TPA: SH3 domain-containing protein [Stellaceae bacterium]|nr:SH3 domain-containing protein [Stellaceae bacterium]
MPATDSHSRFSRGLAVLLLLLAMALAPRLLQAATDQNAYPRFASLRASEVNLRAGPGEQYPIEWVYKRKDFPVEVVGKYDVWRKIRDWQGTEGWVHQRMLADTRSVIVRGEVRFLHANPDPTASVVARLEPGVIAKLLECQGLWCRVEVQSLRGWLSRNEIWGVYPDEVVR